MLAEEWPRKCVGSYAALASMIQKDLLLFKTYCLFKELVLAVLTLYCYTVSSWWCFLPAMSPDQGSGVLPRTFLGKMAWIATVGNVLTLYINMHRNVGMGHPKCSGWHLHQIDIVGNGREGRPGARAPTSAQGAWGAPTRPGGDGRMGCLWSLWVEGVGMWMYMYLC